MYSDQYLEARAEAMSQAGLDSPPHRQRVDSPEDGDYRFRFYDEANELIADVTVARTAPDPSYPSVDWS